MKENNNKTECNSIEVNIKLLEKLDYLLDDVYSTCLINDEERNEYQYAIEHILSDYKRVLKENEMHKRNSEIMSKENLSTAEQLKVEIKENFRLKNQLENNRKEYQETYKDVREELKELKKENKELKDEIMDKDLEIIGKEEYTKASMGEIIEQYYTANEDCIPKKKIKEKIEKYKKMCISNVKSYENYFKDNYDELVYRRIDQLEKELLGGEK